MKKIFLLSLLIIAGISGIASNWISISSALPAPAKTQLVSSDIQRSQVHFRMDGFNLREVQTPRGTAYSVSLEKATPILQEGAPDVPKLTASVIIPDRAMMNIRIVSSSYKDYTGMDIAPSKGVIMRDIDPSTVPFRYGREYNMDKFFPGNLSDARDPFIIRDLRGQTMIIYPFQYNPVTKTLRVYYDITVEIYKSGENGVNPLLRTGKMVSVNSPFSTVYSHEFLNFANLDYTPVNDYGNMLVICHGPFMSAMLPYVNWKNSIGYPTKLVNVADIGTTAAAIKTYITNYYNQHGLTFVLLVGDGPQIPTNTGGGLGGPSDNAYGYIVGNDHYADLFVGRFSAETVAQVQTQVQRSVDYEKSPQFLTDDWFSTVIGIGSDQGPGDDNEYDYQHIRNQQTQLLAYTYTWNPELFDGSQGGNDATGNPTPATVSTAVNEGAGLMLYCGHGSQTSWGTSGFSNSNVNQLTNQGKLPFIWSVACVNGDFTNGTCFAESWLRATQGGQPTGAVAFLGSTINQSWNSPMAGQDEMTDILSESYTNNVKRTFAGLSINGCMKMIDTYGSDGSNMADTWTVFGDPTLQVRTATPALLTVSHDPMLFVGATSLTVTCDVNGARATASLNDSLLATGLIANNTVTLTFPALLSPTDTVHLVVTAFNHLPYFDDILVITPSGPYVVYYSNHANDTTGNNNDMVDYGEDILLSVGVKNVGVAPATNLNVKIRANDSFITVSDSTEAYGTLAPNEVHSVPDAYQFHASNHIPDGHSIHFTVISSSGADTWNSNFTISAHAPILAMGYVNVSDPGGNFNFRLDPGETDNLQIFINNTGSSGAYNVVGHLVAINPYITITEDQLAYGNIDAGGSANQVFTIHVDSLAPQGETAHFLLEISADRGITASGSFGLVIGKIPALVVDYDGNTNSGPLIRQAIQSLSLGADYVTTAIPDTLDKYTSIFVCLGVYPDNIALSSSDGQKLAGYLTNGGRVYMEGGDTWFYDPQTAVHTMFNISGLADGSGDLGTINGYTGTFTEGMSFNYTGDNAYIDHLGAISPAYLIFKNYLPVYDNAVAHDAGTYKTIGSAFEFGGLSDGVYPSTRAHLMEEYLNFFGIQPPPLMANFVGYPTTVTPSASVSFSDYSTGGITTWNWSFPGGTPSTSTDQNPVVTYFNLGTYDVQLIVSNGTAQDTMIRPGYIHCDFPAGIQGNTGAISCTVSPNPNNGRFTVDITSGKNDRVTMEVWNTLGKDVYREDGIPVDGKITKVLDLSSLPGGVYILEVKGTGSTITEKVILKK
jgi:PKD repeat protein